MLSKTESQGSRQSNSPHSQGCSIIIPTFNTKDLTLRSIECLLQNPPKMNFEIIVVDNASSDGTLEAIRKRFREVVVIRNDRNLGFSRACNRGAAEASGRFLLFLNSDTEVQKGTFEHLIQWLESHSNTGVVGPKLIGPNERAIQMSWVWNPLLAGELIQQYFAPYAVRRSRFRQRLIQWLQNRSKSVPSICGACIMVRRDVFDQIGGFDEDFELYFEDSDICLRCRQAGWNIDFVAESKLMHRLGQSTRRSPWNSTSLIYQQSHIAFYRKHAPKWAVAMLKGYLLIKWIRLEIVSRQDQAHRTAGAAYCKAYFKMILEKEKVTLEKGIPS